VTWHGNPTSVAKAFGAQSCELFLHEKMETAEALNKHTGKVINSCSVCGGFQTQTKVSQVQGRSKTLSMDKLDKSEASALLKKALQLLATCCLVHTTVNNLHYCLCTAAAFPTSDIRARRCGEILSAFESPSSSLYSNFCLPGPSVDSAAQFLRSICLNI